MRQSRTRGFTLLELLVALSVVFILVSAGLVSAGRVFVEDGDAVRAARSSGIAAPRIVERHNFLAWRRGCTTGDAVAFTVNGSDAHGVPTEITVCCGTWFQGCVVR